MPARGDDRPPAPRVADVDAIRRRLELEPGYGSVAGVESIKVAVLDQGFDGLASGRAYLPTSAEVVEHYDPDFIRKFDLGDPEFRKGLEPGDRHGRVMAQIVWAVTGSRPDGPKFYLLNANGPTMLRRAVRFAIERRVDLILFSGSFEGGGDGDGRGPINRVVADALAADIPWINAAGNYGGRVYNGPIRILPDGYLKLRDGSDVASLRFRNRVDDNTVTVTLTWDDYRDREDAGTDKDLDFLVEDEAGRPIGSSAKDQLLAGPNDPGPDGTRNPRERVVLPNLPAGRFVASDPDYAYRIRIKARPESHFDPDDRLRVLVTPSRPTFVPPGADAPSPAFEFLDASGEGELFPPADHPLVLTIGDADPASSVGPTADRRVKPDAILANSRVDFTDGEISAGSSNAAAYVAGVVAVLKAVEPSLRPADLLRIARQGPPVPAAALLGRSPRSATKDLGLHFWQTPTRTRLAEILRAGR